MAYKALYREYRPRRFSDLRGQGMISEILKNQVKAQEPSHAYIFIGPRGTGKTSTAKILAMALNCLHPKDGEPCLECENCQEALADSMIDIIEIDAASNNSVENARDIRDKINLLPVKGKYKIYIIDEVHMLSDSAYNALLKTIEEPPSYAVFVLATTELNKLPKTILSRCQRFDFKNIDEGAIVGRMQEVLASIGKTADEDALAKIAEYSDGGMRDALTVLEKCTIIKDNIDMETVLGVLNYADDSSVRQLLSAVRDYDGKTALDTLQRILDAGIEPSVLVEQMMGTLQKVIRASVGALGGGYAEIAKGWDRASLTKTMEKIADTDCRMRLSTKPAILLESAIMDLMLPEAQGDEALALRIAKLEKQIALGTTAARPATPPRMSVDTPPEKSVPKAAAQKKAGAGKDPAGLLEGLKNAMAKNLLYGDIVNALEISSLSGNKITFTSENKTAQLMLEDEKFIGVLRNAIEKQTGEAPVIEVEKTSESLGDIDVEIID